MEIIGLIVTICILAFCIPLLMQIILGFCEIAAWIVVLLVGGICYLAECTIDFLRRIKWIR